MGGNMLKLGIAVILFGIAGVLFVTLRGESDAPGLATGASLGEVDFLCTGCGHHYEMERDAARAALAAAPVREAAAGTGAAKARGAAGRGLPKFITCEKCGEALALLARACERDGAYVPIYNPDGTTGKCP